MLDVPTFRLIRLVTLTLLALTRVAGEDLKALYEAHRWGDLAMAVQTEKKVPPIYHAVIATVFNDNNRGERILRSILRSSPAPDVLPMAYEALVHIYLRTGRYHSLSEIVKEARAAVPSLGWPETAFVAFEGLPDQVTGHPRHASLNHEPGEIFIPATINHQSVTYFFDTGGWLNSMSESEARRLGMRFEGPSSNAKVTTSTGGQVPMRMAVAPDVAIGGIHYRNVSFAVFPDNQEPWSLLPEGRRGLLGISLIQGFQTLRWDPNGGMEIGFRPRAMDLSMVNLYFNDDNLVVASDTNGEGVLTTVDTGALTTDLYENFAKRFAKLISERGTKEKHDIRGVGNALTFEAVTIPQLPFTLGGMDVVLAPAHVMLKPIGNQRCVGNFGMDLFRQGRYLSIDLRAMRLQLTP
jgi:predicted aspartyl protease